VILRYLANVRDNFIESDSRGSRAKRSAIDQHVKFVPAKVECNKETIAQALPVHSYPHRWPYFVRFGT